MTEKTIVRTDRAPAAIGPYSQGVRVGNLFFFSGVIPLDPDTGALVGADAAEQTAQVLQNIRALLASQGLSPQNVVKTTVFVRDMGDFAKVNAIYAETFSSQPPARSCVEVSALPSGALVEIEVVAAK